MSYQGSPFSGHVQDEYEYDEDGYDDLDEYRYNEDPMPPLRCDDSDEDTEEASETDMANNDEPLQIKEQMYHDKLAFLKKQLQQLKEGTHPEYNKRVKRLEHQYHERLRVNKIYRDHMLECVEREYVVEKKAAAKEFEEKKIELKENLLTDFEDKRKHIEGERHTMELNGDSMEVKPAMTRKLRRRPNEPAPVPEKRRKPPATTLAFLLEERDVEADLRAITRARHSAASPQHTHTHTNNKHHPAAERTHHIATLPPRKHTNSNCSDSVGRDVRDSRDSRDSRAASPCADARVEDGKLLYERRWFHRGQAVYVEGRDLARFAGHIAAIGTDAIWVKRNNLEGNKMKIYTSQLARGKVIIKRRAS